MTRRWLLGAACAAIAIAVLAARPVRTPGPLARDFEAYWAAGSTYNANADPYSRTIWDAEQGVPGVNAMRDELLPFVGPPATLLVWSVAAKWSYDTAARAWWVVLAFALLALVAAVAVGGGTPLTFDTVAAAALLAIAFAPISSDLALGQVALPAFAAACAAVVLSKRSLGLAAACACVAFAQPNASLGLISQMGRNRATLVLIAGLLGAYVLGAVAAGWEWPVVYARMLSEHAAAERFDAIQFSPAAIAYGFGAAPAAALGAGLVVAAISVAAGVAIAVRVGESFARFAALSALIPFVAGFVHEHDLVVAYAAAAWCAIRTHAGARAFALAGTLLVCIDWLGLAQRPTGIVQSGLLAVAAFAAFAALGERSGALRQAPVVAGIGILVFAAAFVAARHPVPVWPDALANFHAPAQASSASVWLAEQRASGLLAAVPSWSLLRSLPLLGCALLAYAIYRHSSCCRTA